MSLKKKLAMSIATGALAVSMIGGGTYAYFNDVETSVNTFAAGTLDLAVNPETIINVTHLKPGDWMNRTFKLENNGTLDISKVFLTTAYTESVPGFGDQIVVDFMTNGDKADSKVIVSKTLSQLKKLSQDAVDNTSPLVPNGWHGWKQNGEVDGIKAGTFDNMHVKFRFKDEGDQNAYQGAELTLSWTFNAQQTEGKEIKLNN